MGNLRTHRSQTETGRKERRDRPFTGLSEHAKFRLRFYDKLVRVDQGLDYTLQTQCDLRLGKCGSRARNDRMSTELF